MIKPLRKRHLQIWSVLLVLIPAGIIVGWASVKKIAPGNTIQPASEQALPNIILSKEKENFTVRLRGNESGALQLEWINKNALTVPTAVIYKATPGKQGIESAELIGRIEAKGTYYFSVRKDSTKGKAKLILYDFIHEQIVDSINFEP